MTLYQHKPTIKAIKIKTADGTIKSGERSAKQFIFTVVKISAKTGLDSSIGLSWLQKRNAFLPQSENVRFVAVSPGLIISLVLIGVGSPTGIWPPSHKGHLGQ